MNFIVKALISFIPIPVSWCPNNLANLRVGRVGDLEWRNFWLNDNINGAGEKGAKSPAFLTFVKF